MFSPSTPLLSTSKERAQESPLRRPFRKAMISATVHIGWNKGDTRKLHTNPFRSSQALPKAECCPLSACNYAEKQTWTNTGLQHLPENISDPLCKRQVHSIPWEQAPPLHPHPALLLCGKAWPHINARIQPSSPQQGYSWAAAEALL